MLNKNENNSIENIIIREGKNIYYLIKNNEVKKAFIKYNTIRDLLSIFNKKLN